MANDAATTTLKIHLWHESSYTLAYNPIAQVDYDVKAIEGCLHRAVREVIIGHTLRIHILNMVLHFGTAPMLGSRNWPTYRHVEDGRADNVRKAVNNSIAIL
jgi:AcrR family transcriptional regulator